MTKKFRPGSMGAADAKNEKLVLIIFSALFFVCYLLWVVPSNLYSHYYFSQAGGFSKVLGLLSIAAHYYVLWVKYRDQSEPTGSLGFKSAAILFGWFVLNLALLSGFNFDLP